MKNIFMWLAIVVFVVLVGMVFNEYYPLPTEESGIQYVHNRSMALIFTVLGTGLTIVSGFVTYFRLQWK